VKQFVTVFALSIAALVAAHAQQQAPAVYPWPAIMQKRQQLLDIYAADRAKCFRPPDQVQDYCALAQSEVSAIRQLDQEIADAQREIASYGARQ
jgi:hypothetical protein